MTLLTESPQAGIFIQIILPVMLFLDREERKSRFWLRIACGMAASMWILCAYKEMLKTTAGYFITYFLVVLAVWSAYRISAMSAIFLSSCGYALQHIAFCLGNFMPQWMMMNEKFYTYFSLFSPVAPCLIFYFALLRQNRYVYRNADYRQVLLSGVLLFICIALSSLRGGETTGIMYFNLYDLLLCVCCLMLQFSISYSTKIREENRTMELLIRQQHDQHSMSNQALDMLNLKIHNIRHQLADVQQMMEGEDSARLQPFLRTLQIYDTMANTGNPTLDAVLMEKGLMCEINHIRFSFIVDGKQMGFMEIADLFSLVSNILDNAIESERKEEDPERRIINLRIVRSRDMILLDAENYCRYPVEVRDNTVQTTKSDKENHGVGMRGIEYVVKKYGGSMILSQEDDLFRVGIVLPASDK